MKMITETQNMQRDLMKCINAVLQSRNSAERPEITSITRDVSQPVADSAGMSENTPDQPELPKVMKGVSSQVTCEFSPGTLPCRQVAKVATKQANRHETGQETLRQAPMPPPCPPAQFAPKPNQQLQTKVKRVEKSASGLQSALLHEISNATTDIPAFLASARQRRPP